MAATAPVNTTIADGNVTSIFLFPASNLDRDSSFGRLIGSIVSEGPEATAIALDCERAGTDPTDPLDMPFCQPYAGITVTEGPSTFHAATGCAPEETICVEIDCKITGTTEATCIKATTAPAIMLLPPEEFASAVETASGSELTFRGSSTTTLMLTSPDMPYFDLTLGPSPTPYVVENGTTVPLTGVTTTIIPTEDAQGKETSSRDSASPTTGTDAAVASVTGDSSAGHNMLKLSGGLAGAAVVGMALL